MQFQRHQGFSLRPAPGKQPAYTKANYPEYQIPGPQGGAGRQAFTVAHTKMIIFIFWETDFVGSLG